MSSSSHTGSPFPTASAPSAQSPGVSAAASSRSTRRPSRSVPRYVAIHEAGHVLALWHTGWWFNRVTLRPREEWSMPFHGLDGTCTYGRGIVEGVRRYDPLVAAPDVFPEGDVRAFVLRGLRVDMETQCFCCLAGPAAQARYGHQGSNTTVFLGGACDYEVVGEVARHFRGYGGDFDLVARTEKRLRVFFANELIQTATRTLATALRERGTLWVNEAVAIIEAVVPGGLPLEGDVAHWQRPYFHGRGR